MVITQLMGGLGNQFFQYAAGLTLAHDKDVPLKLDISWFKGQSKRKFRLDQFNISAPLATPEEISSIKEMHRKSSRHIFIRLLQRFFPYYCRYEIAQNQFSFDPNLIKAPKDVYLTGYWQSEKYFKKIEDVIRKEFTPKAPLSKRTDSILISMRHSESISIHMRRGDYITERATNNYHGVCAPDYYYRAIDMMTLMVKRPVFFVFSDDIEWVKKNISIKHPTFYVSHSLNGNNTDHEELYLLGNSKYHIISNSSFSWWGAWLCDYSSKKVIAPERWFSDPAIDTSDLVPDSWLRI